MYLVTESKSKENQLGFSPRKSIYSYLHNGKVIWEVKGDKSLFEYFNEIRETYSPIDEELIKDNPIWIMYCESCESYER